MTTELAWEYIAQRMKELDVSDYTFRFRHFVLQPGETVQVEAWQELFLLVKETCEARISSDFGIFDLSADNASEMQYEHQGMITMENASTSAIVHVRFIQVIPKQYNHGN